MLQGRVQFSWAEDDEAALEGARVWKGAQPYEFYTDDWHDPRKMYEEGEKQISNNDLNKKGCLSSPQIRNSTPTVSARWSGSGRRR